MDPDGDFVVGQNTLDSTGGGTWKFLQGTGKWKGITGGGKFVPVTSGKPTVAGTGQGCVRASGDRKSTRLNSSHPSISYAVFCLKKKKQKTKKQADTKHKISNV